MGVDLAESHAVEEINANENAEHIWQPQDDHRFVGITGFLSHESENEIAGT
jgi:hypothetical protein